MDKSEGNFRGMTSRIWRSITLSALSAKCLLKVFAAQIWLSLHKIRRDHAGDEYSFVIYSIIPWDGVWQRPQHFATRLAKHNKVLYVDPVGLQHIVAASGNSPAVVTRINEKLTVLRPQVLPGGKTRSRIIDLNDAIILQAIHTHLGRTEQTKPVLITNTPLANTMAVKYPWEAVVYDVIDDFISASWAPSDAADRERELFSRADTVFTGTYSLWEKKQSFHSESEFIPCGVEVDHFTRANDPDRIVPDDIGSLPKPVFGYFGGLNERLDADLLCELARSYPNGSVVLIGPIFSDFGLSDFSDPWASVLPNPSAPGFRLKECPKNIHLLGIRPYEQLPSYLKAFDICLLPYVLNKVTRDIHPVKILEYLAAGRPVVSTPLPDVKRFYSETVSIADSRESFMGCIEKILATESEETVRSRIEFAKEKTWEKMAERMHEKIVSALERKD
jgi:glycosyltransferase involved in cell wall biosynthesis